MRKLLEHESELGASQGANNSAAHFPAPTVPNESGDVEGDNPDHNTEKDAAMEDGASAHIDEGWGAWPHVDWWGTPWSYGGYVPNVQPTQSGTSGATAHDVSLDELVSPPGVLKVAVSKDQILYVQEKDGRWKLNSKISPIDAPEEWEFKGYFWGHDKTQAYAYFTRMHANCPGARRSRPRGGRSKDRYR